MNYRIVLGPAVFLHNNTYLQCDSAAWNVDIEVIEAFDNVKIIQDKTMLQSDRLTYHISSNVASFRGDIVELSDKDGNILRTQNLDYNTKDSVATFNYGGAMKDKDGNVIESFRGRYDAKLGSFNFEQRVEMFTDSTEIISTSLNYVTDESKAYFGKKTYMWRGTGFMYADAGWYDRGKNIIYFAKDAYMNDPDYEAWADEIYYYRDSGLVQMFNNVQVLDTANTAILLADKAEYLKDSLWAALTGSPAVVYYGENENHERDSAFVAADTMYCYRVKMCDIPKEEVEEAKKRREDVLFDALAQIRREQAEKRAKEEHEKKKQYGLLPPENISANSDSTATSGMADSTAVGGLSKAPLDSAAVAPQGDSLSVAVGAALDAHGKATLDSLGVVTLKDSLAVGTALDSLGVAAVADSVAVVRDTTLVMHLKAFHNVKMYREDVQARCDSVFFSELDSIARMFGSPILWNAVKNQLTSETMQILLKDGAMHRGSMLTDAMITTKEDSTHFNQIKSTEMMGFFKDNQLERYDALGGVTALFHMVEGEAITTINVKESQSLTAVIKDGNAQKMLYLEGIKSDAYPVGELAPEKQRLKGFNWRGDERPVDRFEVTRRAIKPTQRERYIHIVRPTFSTVNKYFDNYMLLSPAEVIE